LSGEGFEVERFERYPVEIPLEEVRAGPRDLLPTLKAVYMAGIGVLTAASLTLMYLNPDVELSIYILIMSVITSLPLTIMNMVDVFYGVDWMRMMVECEIPYFLASLKFLVNSGMDVLESFKQLVGGGSFKYISWTLSGAEDVRSKEELETLANKSKSPFLRRAIKELLMKFERMDVLMDEAYRNCAEYGMEYMKVLNRTYRSAFYILAFSSAIPVLLPIYHAYVYMELGEGYISRWVYASTMYMSLIFIGISLIIASTIFVRKPRLMPVVKIEIDRLRTWEFNRMDVAFIVAASLSLAVAVVMRQVAPFALATLIYLVYNRCSTFSDIRRIGDVINEFTYLFKEVGLDGAVSAIATRSYGDYIDYKIREMGVRYMRTKRIEIDEENLRPFLKTVEIASKMGLRREAIEEYALDVTSLFGIPRYVESQFKATNPRPYLGYMIIILAFIPLMYASSYVLGFISIPIFMLFNMMSTMRLFPYQSGNWTEFDWSSFWGGLNVSGNISIPPLSGDIFNTLSIMAMLMAISLGLIEGLSRKDYRPVNMIFYVGGLVALNLAIMSLTTFLSQISGLTLAGI